MYVLTRLNMGNILLNIFFIIRLHTIKFFTGSNIYFGKLYVKATNIHFIEQAFL